ncbi:homocysteine S-methyltransferase family protein [Streptomyces sp. MBT53]|nr:homocysteine S-methyltransferase family protein [Streptomyces sp. MBT53]
MLVGAASSGAAVVLWAIVRLIVRTAFVAHVQWIDALRAPAILLACVFLSACWCLDIRWLLCAVCLLGAAVTASYQAAYEGFARLGSSRAETTTLLRRSVTLAREAAAGEDWGAASVGRYGAMPADGCEYRGDYGTSGHASDFDKADSVGKKIPYQVNMYDPLYYLSDSYAGYKSAKVACLALLVSRHRVGPPRRSGDPHPR